jgi:hypothetical protein
MAVPYNETLGGRYQGIYREETTYFPLPLNERRQPPPDEVKNGVVSAELAALLLGLVACTSL